MIARDDPRRGHGFLGSLSVDELVPADAQAIADERAKNNAPRRMTDRRRNEP